jgi:hypothetical protein
MNWYAHAVVAEQRSAEPGWVLGAMLPDLAAAIGTRVVPPGPGELLGGLRHHARADAAFHAAPEFVELVAGGRAALAGSGLARGSAWAAAHVGVELLLDGWLAERCPPSAAFGAAVARAAALAERPALLRPAPEPGRWLALCARLRAGDLPRAYARPARAALGVERTLARHPRLALRAGERAALARWLAEARAPVAARAGALLARAGA